MVHVKDSLVRWKERVMFEKILDKIDEWNARIYDWQRTSTSRATIVFCLNVMLVIPFAFIIMGIVGGFLIFIGWAAGALLGV